MSHSRIYLKNRAEFYEALLPRIPNRTLAERLAQAVTPVRFAPDLVDFAQELPESPPPDPVLRALKLDDLLKKGHSGQQMGKVVISFRDALAQAEHVERVGLSWFETLVKQELISISEANLVIQSLARCLGNILTLRDDLEFHRLKLVPQP